MNITFFITNRQSFWNNFFNQGIKFTAIFDIALLKGKTKVITNGQLEERVISKGTNENSKLTHVTCVQRGKTRATKSRFLLVLHLIGWKVVHDILTNQIAYSVYYNLIILSTLNQKLFPLTCL